jgi:hypothetical protein
MKSSRSQGTISKDKIGRMRDIKQSLKKLMAKIDQPPKDSPVRQHLFGD